MTDAFKTALPTVAKFVLVALCDNANDQGECYPSIPMLQMKCSLSDRGVQKAIAYLEQMRFIRRDYRTGRSTLYQILPPAAWPKLTPEHDSPRTTFTPNDVHPTPERCSPPPPNDVHPTPEPRSPITINEPSIEPSGNRHKGSAKKPAALPALPDWVPVDAWEGFADMRKRKGKPLTERAQILILKTLRTLHESGHDVAAILDRSTVNAWTDVYAPRQDGVASLRAPKQTLFEQNQEAAERARKMLFGDNDAAA